MKLVSVFKNQVLLLVRKWSQRRDNNGIQKGIALAD
jgi:hypothetical protein